MTSFNKLGPNYFKNYLENLPENAQANRKFSYKPWASNCPELSLKNVFGIIRFVLTYPVVHLRDFWKARQVKQSNEEARQVALAALKKEVADEELSPIRHLALLSNVTLLSRKAQELINIDDRIEVNARTIHIDRTITLKHNDNEIGTLKIQAVFDCQKQIGSKRFSVTLNN